MELLEYVIVCVVFGSLAHELLDISTCAEGLGDFAEEEDDLDVRGRLMLAHCLGNAGSHVEAERVVIFGTIEINEADLVLGLGLDLAKADPALEGGKSPANMSHTLLDMYQGHLMRIV